MVFVEGAVEFGDWLGTGASGNKADLLSADTWVHTTVASNANTRSRFILPLPMIPSTVLEC